MKITSFSQQMVMVVFAIYFGQEVLYVSFEKTELTRSIIFYAIGLGWCLAAMVYLLLLEVKEGLFQMMKELNKEIMAHNKELSKQNFIRYDKK